MTEFKGDKYDRKYALKSMLSTLCLQLSTRRISLMMSVARGLRDTSNSPVGDYVVNVYALVDRRFTTFTMLIADKLISNGCISEVLYRNIDRHVRHFAAQLASGHKAKRLAFHSLPNGLVEIRKETR